MGVPTYNRPHYLPGAIDCWLAQTYKNFELILSDDASPNPDVQKICEEYAKKDKRIRYIRQKGNLNVPFHFKVVLQEARGEYFIWATDDDLWHERLLEDCVNVFRQRPELVMVFPHMVDIDKNGREIRHLHPAKYIPLEENLYKRLKAFFLFRFGDGKNQLFLGLWKREVILHDPLFGPRAKDDHFPCYWGFDNYFIFRNLAKGPVGFVPHVRFFRRSRVLEEYRPPRPFVPRLFFTLARRFEKIFATPYFWYVMRRIMSLKELSLLEKFKLILWNFYVMARLFCVRKI